MNFPKFAANNFEQRFFVATANANSDFTFRIVFNNFCARSVVGKDDPIFPNVILVFYTLVSFYDEAGEDTFGHEVVAVAEDEVVGFVPVVVG